MSTNSALQNQIELLWKIQLLDLKILELQWPPVPQAAQSGSPNAAAGDAAPSLQSLSEQRAALLKNLSRELAQRYERIRNGRGGIGLATARSGRCTLCNMAIPAQLFNEIIASRGIHSCQTCLRILLPEAPAPTAAGTEGTDS